MQRRRLNILLITSILLVLACSGSQSAQPQATVAEAEKFIEETERLLARLSEKAARAAWVQANFITEDTEIIASQANQEYIEVLTRLASEVKRFDGLKLPPVLDRKFMLLKLNLFSLSDPKEREEVAKLGTSLEAEYGKGKACVDTGRLAGKCLPIGEVEQVMASSRDPEELKSVWTAWHAVGAPMRDKYTRFIQLQNKGAQELGFKDMGAMWRSRYDMPPAEFEAELERLWNQVRPLYESLHAYVRTRIQEQYGAQPSRKKG